MLEEEEQYSDNEEDSSMQEEHEIADKENLDGKEKDEKGEVKKLIDLKVSKLLDFKELVEEIYGEEVFRKLEKEELKGLFSKITPKARVVEGQSSLKVE